MKILQCETQPRGRQEENCCINTLDEQPKCRLKTALSSQPPIPLSQSLTRDAGVLRGEQDLARDAGVLRSEQGLTRDSGVLKGKQDLNEDTGVLRGKKDLIWIIYPHLVTLFEKS